MSAQTLVGIDSSLMRHASAPHSVPRWPSLGRLCLQGTFCCRGDRKPSAFTDVLSRDEVTSGVIDEVRLLRI